MDLQHVLNFAIGAVLAALGWFARQLWDAVDAEGKPVYQGVDTSFLVATLTKAIQELNAKVEGLQEATAVAYAAREKYHGAFANHGQNMGGSHSS